MIAVIFELEPREGKKAEYFELAASLRPTLQAMDGFISVERFESLSTPGRFLSLSFWRDEQAVRNWRCTGLHRDAQQQGRAGRPRLCKAGPIRLEQLVSAVQAVD